MNQAHQRPSLRHRRILCRCTTSHTGMTARTWELHNEAATDHRRPATT